MTRRRKYRNPTNIKGAPSPLYQCWRNMKRRCYDPKYKGYKSYGARGIKVHKPWLEDFDKFADFAIAHGWEQGKALSLVNADLDFKPDNVVFLSMEQVLGRSYDHGNGHTLRRNRRPVINIEQGKLYPSVRAAATENGGYENSLSRALRNGSRYMESYWIYADIDKSVEEQVTGFVPKVRDSEKVRRGTPIRNKTSGRVFTSVMEAAEAYNVTTGSIHSALRNGTRAAESYWERITPETYRILN